MLMSIDVEIWLAACFYLVLSLWWYISVTTKYAKCIRGNTDYLSRVTYPCCGILRKWPAEGVFKLIFSLLIVAISALKCYRNCDDSRKLAEVTVFVVFAVSGLCDILTQKCQRYVFYSADCFFLMFAFLLQAIVSAGHVDLTSSSLAVTDECAMYAASLIAIAILLEFRYTHVIWFSLLRCFSTLVLATWNFHVAILVNKENKYNQSEVKLNISFVKTLNNTSTAIISNETLPGDDDYHYGQGDPGHNDNHLLLLPMYFAWHCFLAMFTLTILWLIISRFSHRLVCSTQEEDEESHFEHHINFDYHIIDRLDSDLE